MNNTWTSIIEVPAKALEESLNSFIIALPKAITALLILFLGWVIGKISEIIVRKILVASQVDEWIKKKRLKESLFNINLAHVGGLLVKYYIIVVFLKEASVRAGLTFLADMFDALLTAIPDIIIGASIIIVGLLFADFIRKKIKKALIPFNENVAEVTYGIIIFFAIVMALPKFGITNTSLIEDSFKYIILGVSVGISIAIGIGFGWAIKEGPAKEFFKKKKH